MVKQKDNAVIHCADCGSRLPDEWMQKANRDACPNCGSHRMTLHLELMDEANINLHESLAGKTKDQRFNAKRNPRYEFFDGDDLRVSDGKWMQKNRTIDKYNDRYTEKITDPRTGETVHYCDEPLSDHFGHGSAKFNKDG